VRHRLPPRGVGTLLRMAMDTDQAFEAWLSAWSKAHILPTHGLLEGADLYYLAKQRAAELIQQAKDKGFDDELAEIVRPYHSVLKYVTHLMWEADFDAVRSRYSGDSGDT
jgi:hypothetical protein